MLALCYANPKRATELTLLILAMNSHDLTLHVFVVNEKIERQTFLFLFVCVLKLAASLEG